MAAIVDDRMLKGLQFGGTAPTAARLDEEEHDRAFRFAGGSEAAAAEYRRRVLIGRQFEKWKWFARHETFEDRPWDHEWSRPTDRYDGGAIQCERDFARRVWGPILAPLPSCEIPHPGPLDVSHRRSNLAVRHPLVKRPIPLRMMLSPRQVEILDEPWEPFPARTAAMGFRIEHRVFINETATSQIRFEFWIRPTEWMVQPGWQEIVACFVCPTPKHHHDMVRGDAELATDMLNALEARRPGGDEARMGAIRWWMVGRE